jgi:tetratricopeptide (TPR) repeat protein
MPLNAACGVRRSWRVAGTTLVLWSSLHAGAPASARAEEGPPPAATAEAMSADARAHYDRGLARYADKDYPAAIAELQAGYALEPRREFLFVEAQARRLSGDCKNAVPLYQRFLTSGPDDVQVNATHIALGRCAAQMASAPRATAPLVATVPRPAPAPPPPWYQDVAGGALLGAGLLGIAGGAVFTVGSFSARDDANQRSSTYEEYARHWDTARSRERIAIIGFAAGAALTGAAIVRYVRVRARAAAPGKLQAWVAPGGRGGVAGLEGWF